MFRSTYTTYFSLLILLLYPIHLYHQLANSTYSLSSLARGSYTIAAYRWHLLSLYRAFNSSSAKESERGKGSGRKKGKKGDSEVERGLDST